MTRLLRATLRANGWIVIALCALAAPAAAEEPAAPAGAAAQAGPAPRVRPWYLSDRVYFEPLTAEPHAARLFILLPGWTEQFPHSIESGSRFGWQITLGREIPILGIETQAPSPVHMAKGRWGFGLWTPVSFHMIEDFKDESAPIVDTDYRFGAMLKGEYGVTDNMSLNVRFVPWAHESTHLGDEYTILASRSATFERINVSYEYWSYGVSFGYRFPVSSLTATTPSRFLDGSGSLTVRHTGMTLWGEDGYYSNHVLGDDTPTITPSTKNYEPAFGAELRLPVRADGGTAARQWLVSFDVRPRLQYDYHQDPIGSDERRWSWAATIGRATQEGQSRVLSQYFLYLYRGVNPYGQLRSQGDYWSAGLGWIFR